MAKISEMTVWTVHDGEQKGVCSLLSGQEMIIKKPIIPQLSAVPNMIIVKPFGKEDLILSFYRVLVYKDLYGWK